MLKKLLKHANQERKGIEALMENKEHQTSFIFTVIITIGHI